MRPAPVVFLLLTLIPTVAHAQGSDWPKFLGPLGTSVSAEKGIITPWPQTGLKIVWQKTIGAGYGMPIVANGKLYHFDRKPNRLGKGDNNDDSKNLRLMCMDAK